MKFVTDVSSHKWAIISDNRRNYQSSIRNPQSNLCPFCPGQEETNEELFRIGSDKDWKVRIIKNKYPVTANHEVIIHSPDHKKDIDELPIEQTQLLLRTYRERFNFYKNHGQVFIFQNHDLYAGASISHPHSQLVVIPNEIPIEPNVKEPVKNIVWENDFFVAYCPDFSQWAYEVWIAPKESPDQTFGETSDLQLENLAVILQKILKVMVVKFEIKKEMVKKGITDEFPYNFYIYQGKNWYLRVIPRLARHGGFELATSIHINSADPITACQELRALNN